jgi:cyanophycinase
MKLLLTLPLAALLASSALAQSPSPSPSVAPPEIGPAKGTLVIVGGGLKSESILKRFLDLAGGPEANLVIIPTAGESDDLADYAGDLRDLTDAGARHVKVIHTRDRKMADTEAFVAPLRDARGVWFPAPTSARARTPPSATFWPAAA